MSLLSDLDALKRKHHIEEEDNWYSCPKSGQCSRDEAGDICNCGADAHNKQVKRLTARLAPIREVWEKYKEHDTRFQNAVLTYGYNDSDVRDVFHDCWQAIRKAMEEQR